MKGKRGATILVLIVLLLLSVLLSLSSGAVKIPPGDIARAFLQGRGSSPNADILLGIRLPRVLLAGIAGSSLAVSGAILQGVFMNPLADPYVIGVSSGASLGAVLAIVLHPAIAIGGLGALPLFSMVGALLTIVAVQRLSSVDGRASVMSILLAGIATSAFLSAVISAVTYLFDDRVHQVWLWMVGGFSHASWELVTMALPYTMVGMACSMAFTRDLNALTLGEDTAAHLGVNVRLVRNVLVWTAALLAASAVSSAGLIGFVGMITPHICRTVSPDHRFLVPSSALAGALAMVLADAVCRSVMAPQEVPVGIITSLVGGPFFVYLLRRAQRAGRPGSGGVMG
ncbi:MAG: FecCD family ABC transporter permease [Ignavibacteriales bacterium]